MAKALASHRFYKLPLLLLTQLLAVSKFHSDTVVDAVKCLDCIGEDCMGTFCNGDLCVLSIYAPRWGSQSWGNPEVVKGCMTGKMIRKDIRSHCETSDAEGQDIFTCFCDTDNCNGKRVRRLEIEQVEMLECICSGSHCKGRKTCLGELCSYVTNHKTKEVEQGCINASVPLIERRSAGSCMMPPITGAMHHSLAREPKHLLNTESCVCGTSFCNEQKPEITVDEKQDCQAFVETVVLGSKTEASNKRGCKGEFCFKAEIKSKMGQMNSFRTSGCASFTEEAVLAEELDPVGCAKFESENLEVEACFQTKDRSAIGRARAGQQIREPPSRTRGSKAGSKGRSKVEITTFDNDDDEIKDEHEEEENDQENLQKSKSTEEEKDTDDSEDWDNQEDQPKKTTLQHYIFERPTLPPEPEDSNTALIAVFLLLILLIILSALVWKFELHKKLFRANYDVVAGG